MTRAVARALAIGLLLMIGPLLAPSAAAVDVPRPAIAVTAPETVVAGVDFVVGGELPRLGLERATDMTFTFDGAVVPSVVARVPDGTRWTAPFRVEKPGTYTVSASMPGRATGVATVTVVALPVITVTAPRTVVAGADFVVAGEVAPFLVEGTFDMTFTLDGAVVPSVVVKFPGGTRWTASFRVEAPGTYTVSASMPGWSTGASRVTVVPPPVVITLDAGPATTVTGAPLTLGATVQGGTGEGRLSLSVVRPGGRVEEPVVSVAGRSATGTYTGTVPGAGVVIARWTQADEQVFEKRAAHTWTRPPPGLTLTPASARSTVGTALALTATLSDPVGREGSLRIAVDGVAAPAPLKVSGALPTFTASYVGAAAAAGHVHTITATWTEQDGTVVTATARHTWDPPEIALSVPAGPADIGRTATVSVRVPDLLGGTLQVRILTGPHAGPLTVTGTAPDFRSTYPGRFPGPDTIQASVVGSRIGTFSSAVETTTWNTPKVVLAPQGGTSSLVSAVQAVTATVTGVTAADVAFRVDGANAGVAVTRGGGHPVTTASWVGAKAGTDTVTATITVNGRTYASAPLTLTWVQPTIVVGQDTATSGVGQPVALTATVGPAGVTGAVTFTVQGPGSGPMTLRDDGTDGSWTASYTRRAAGTDTITATLSGATGGVFPAPAITHTWTVAVPPTVALSPAGATTCTGSPFTPTASVTAEGRPVPAVPVRVTVTAPGAPDQVLAATSDADGRATLTYTRPAAGADTVVATSQVGGATLTSAPLAHLWQDCGLTVTIAPPGTTSTAGSRFAPTVTVLDAGGAPVAGAAVALRAVLPGQPDVIPALTTDANGAATAGWTRPVAGAERIEAVVTAGNRTGRAVVDHFWAVAAGLQVALSPAGTSSPSGSAFTATALVTDAGRPVPGVQLAFRAVLSGQPDITGTAVTDGAGLGSVTFTRPVAGTDTVTVDAVTGGRAGRAAVTHLWTAAAGITMTLEPAGTSSPVGAPFTATATLRSAGRPVAGGADVTFRASTDGQPDRTAGARTDAAGNATFTWTRDAAGADQVVATVALPDGRRAEASIQHLWRAADPAAPVIPTPAVPTLAVRGGAVPGGAVTLIGTGCPAGTTVTLLVDGARVTATAVRPDGGYQTTVALPSLAVGRHALVAECAPVRAEGHLDVVVPTTTNGTAAAAATTAVATFAFFVLLGGQVVRFSGGYTPGS